ncbi:AAA family ATPase [Macrococcus equi]|uniref:AAA family ATPase n=1 Tax=Macrococcus equi TaxID=3395462 RepID=UPI0039BECC09
MRPNRLTLKAFGPFKHVTIDFDQLKNNKLFLISGKTGAGKTTLFDGIMYALFGEASTSDRDEAFLRNINATDQEPTEVIYNFNIKNKQYEIYRDLPFVKTGNKTKRATQLSVFEIVDGEKIMLASGLTAGKEAIRSIVKLDANQFRKIFILPQGEFKSLLVAGSKEKTDILRTLFDTSKIQKISQQLKEKVQKEKNAMLAIEAELNVHFCLFNDLYLGEHLSHAEKCQQIEGALAKLQNEVDTGTQSLDIMMKKHEERSKNFQSAYELNQNIAQLQSVKNDFTVLIQDEEKITKQQEDLKYLLQLVHYQATVEDLNQSLENNQRDEQLLKELQAKFQEQSTEFNDFLAKFEAHSKLKEEIDKKNHYIIKNERFSSDKYQNLETDIKNLHEKIEILKNDIKSMDKRIVEIKALQHELDTLEKLNFESDLELGTINNQIEQMSVYIESIRKLQNKIHRMTDAYDNSKDLNAKRKNISEQLHLLQRGEAVQDIEQINGIRASLNVGEKCPVCGNHITTLDDDSHIEAHQLQIELAKINDQIAEHHMKLNIYLEDLEQLHEAEVISSHIQSVTEINKLIAELTIDNLNVDAINQLINKLEILFKQIEVEIKNKVHEKLNVIETQNELSSHKQALHSKIKDVDELAKFLATMESQLIKNESDYENLIDIQKSFKEETQVDDYTIFIKQYEQYQHEVTEFNHQFKLLDRKVNNSEKELSILEQNIKHTEQQIDASRNSIERLNSRLEQFNIPENIKVQYADNDISKTISSFERENKKYFEQKLTLENEIDRLNKLIAGRSPQNLDVLEEDLNKQKQHIDTFRSNLTATREQLKTYHRHYTQLIEKLSEFEENMDEVRSIILLSDALNGNNPQKIDIETYVLIYYLEQTLLLANVRLRKMTSNRYELRRRIEKKGGGKQGLVIDVYDYNANQTRSISSLSGGETFIASLCLALGLSDFVMQNAGGVHLEAVFIDEGFGTLDNETLEVAIDALIDLQTTGKLVGMISHVQLLKERMPAILRVESNGYESHASFEIK